MSSSPYHWLQLESGNDLRSILTVLGSNRCKNRAVEQCEADYRVAEWQPHSHGRRCIVPVETVYEPNYETGQAVRWLIQRPGAVPMGIASIYRQWRGPDGRVLWTFAMLTVNCPSQISFICELSMFLVAVRASIPGAASNDNDLAPISLTVCARGNAACFPQARCRIQSQGNLAMRYSTRPDSQTTPSTPHPHSRANSNTPECCRTKRFTRHCARPATQQNSGWFVDLKTIWV